MIVGRGRGRGKKKRKRKKWGRERGQRRRMEYLRLQMCCEINKIR
jgi:hypothetical protein